MSYSLTIRQTSVYAHAYARYWEIMFQVRKDKKLPKGAILEFGDANLYLSDPCRALDDDRVFLNDGTVVDYNEFFDLGMICQYFRELEYHALNGGRGTVWDKALSADAREARRCLAFWINQYDSVYGPF